MKRVVSTQVVEQWLADHLGDILGKPPNSLDTDTPLVEFGVDSATAIGITGELSDWLGCELDPTLLYEYPTMASLAAFVVTLCEEGAA